jgi:hypothetical protein
MIAFFLALVRLAMAINLVSLHSFPASNPVETFEELKSQGNQPVGSRSTWISSVKTPRRIGRQVESK